MKYEDDRYSVRVDDEDFYDASPLICQSYTLIDKQRGVTVHSVYVSEEENIIPTILENPDYYLSLLHVCTLPYPLKDVVEKQYKCSYGMLFFDEVIPYTQKELQLLERQVDEYELNQLIEIDYNAPKGEPVITCYVGLSSKFNFNE